MEAEPVFEERWAYTGRELAVEVLGLLARVGDDEAIRLLARYVARGHGWGRAVEVLVEAGVAPGRFVPGLSERFPADEALHEALTSANFDLPDTPAMAAMAAADPRMEGVRDRMRLDRQRLKEERRRRRAPTST